MPWECPCAGYHQRLTMSDLCWRVWMGKARLRKVPPGAWSELRERDGGGRCRKVRCRGQGAHGPERWGVEYIGDEGRKGSVR